MVSTWGWTTRGLLDGSRRWRATFVFGLAQLATLAALDGAFGFLGRTFALVRLGEILRGAVVFPPRIFTGFVLFAHAS